MTQRLTTPPAPLAGDDGLTFFSTWRLGTPERQRATVEAIARAWESREWPHEGLLSYSVYEGLDGQTLMHHSQWRDEQAYQDFFARGRDERNAEIDAAVPGIERVGLTRTSRYRGVGPGTGVPTDFTTVEADLAGADLDRRRGWADASLAAHAAVPGLVAAHAHLSTDGTRGLTYAQWTREAGGAVADGTAQRYRFAFGVGPTA